MSSLIRLLYIIAITDDFTRRFNAYCYLNVWDMRGLSVNNRSWVIQNVEPHTIVDYILDHENIIRRTVKVLLGYSDQIGDTSFMENEIDKILCKISDRTQKGSKEYYKPLEKAEAIVIRDYYEQQLKISSVGDDNCKVYNKEGTLISQGYKRVVIGDYGAFIEFKPCHINLENIEQKFAGEPKRKVKYIWLQTKDATKTKVYWQKGAVGYADYIVGSYYVDPEDVVIKYER